MVGNERIWESKSEKVLGIIIGEILNLMAIYSMHVLRGRKITPLMSICFCILSNSVDVS